MDILSVVSMLAKAFITFFISFTALCSALAVHQERKIWAPSNMPSISLFGLVKVFVFNVVWILLCAVGSFLICCKYILTGGKSDIQKEAHLVVEKTAAMICVSLFFGTVKVVGKENLPADENKIPAPVYIANHASQVDLGVVYYIERRFKWIAKKSVVFLPGVGQTMLLGGHVLIDRAKGKNKKSVTTLFDKSNTAIQNGIPMFFFPQGTRKMAERVPFKDGAFIVAQTNGSPLIPISINIPLNIWNSWYPFVRSDIPEVVVTVHKPIEVTGKEDREDLKKKCFEQIYSCLPPIWEKTDKKSN